MNYQQQNFGIIVPSQEKLIPAYQLICEYHDQAISHICCNKQCLTALCPRCIKMHTQEHKQKGEFPELETLEDITQYCQNKLLKIQEQYQENIENLKRKVQESQLVDISKQFEQQVNQLRQFKVKVIEEVYKYFDTLENEIEKLQKQSFNQIELGYSENEKIIELQRQMNICEQNQNQIANQSSFEIIQQVLAKDLDKEIQELNKESQIIKENMQSYIQTMNLQVICKKDLLPSIQKAIQPICYLLNSQAKNQNSNQNLKNIKIKINDQSISRIEFYDYPQDNNFNNQQSYNKQNNLVKSQLKNSETPENTQKKKISTPKIFDSNFQVTDKNFCFPPHSKLDNLNIRDSEPNYEISQLETSKFPSITPKDQNSNQEIYSPTQRGTFNAKNNSQLKNKDQILNQFFPIQDLKNQEPKVQKFTQENNKNNPQQLNNKKEDPNKKGQSPLIYEISNSQTKISQYNQKKLVENINFQITLKDYFNPETFHKYLHFFQHKSKILHLINIEDLASNRKTQIFQINLNIPFRIPRWHKSITQPDGQIMICGGVSCEDKDKRLDSAYFMNFQNNTLVQVKKMNETRSGHSLVYFKNQIYALGGVGDFQSITNSCEKYDSNLNQWQTIASLNKGVQNMCVCNFQDKYLFKFGGKDENDELDQIVERYVPEKNQWQIINFHLLSELTNTFKILSSSACCQINKSQILVFGGTYEDYSDKSNQCFIFQIEEQNNFGQQESQDQLTPQYSIRCFNEKQLPYSEGFWNNQVIIHKNCLFSLQNISTQDGNIVYLDKRNIIKFDQYEWDLIQM